VIGLLVPQLVAVPAGDFLMGNDHGRADERPAHQVEVEPFRAAVSPVTNAEYAAFVEARGHEPARFLGDDRFCEPRQPVVGVSWFDAFAYCEWLAAETGVAFRLPTEAEREYAALGGLEGIDWPWGNEAPEAVEKLQGIVPLERPHVPGPECANGYGLRCMADNVHEWCGDWYDSGYYGVSPLRSPRGPDTGKRRASRGGSWRHQVKFNRISARSSLDPSFRYNDYGFRVYADA
jgi:formylglycine-generating enzyme required for sulfatase activity